MNKIAMVSLSALGGTALFAVSFLGFAKLNGVPLHELPAVGGLFPPQPDEHADHQSDMPPVPADLGIGNVAGPVADHPHAPAVPPDAASHDAAAGQNSASTAAIVRPRETRAGILDVLDTDGLYTQDELRALADSLRAKHRESDQRATELDRREDLLADRLTALDERRRTMDEFAKQLDARDRELKAREAEANRDAETSTSANGKLPAGDLSVFFSDGETEVLVTRLAGFTPAEIAQILIKLPPTRAKELLDALPAARWRECAEAYARAAQTP